MIRTISLLLGLAAGLSACAPSMPKLPQPPLNAALEPVQLTPPQQIIGQNIVAGPGANDAGTQ